MADNSNTKRSLEDEVEEERLDSKRPRNDRGESDCESNDREESYSKNNDREDSDSDDDHYYSEDRSEEGSDDEDDDEEEDGDADDALYPFKLEESHARMNLEVLKVFKDTLRRHPKALGFSTEQGIKKLLDNSRVNAALEDGLKHGLVKSFLNPMQKLFDDNPTTVKCFNGKKQELQRIFELQSGFFTQLETIRTNLVHRVCTNIETFFNRHSRFLLSRYSGKDNDKTRLINGAKFLFFAITSLLKDKYILFLNYDNDDTTKKISSLIDRIGKEKTQ